MGGDTGTAELGIRLVASLAVVIGLLVLIARVAGKRFKAPAGAAVQVVCRQSLTRGSGVAVITVGTRVLVLGTTEQQVTLLAEVEPDEVGLDQDDLLDETPSRQELDVEGNKLLPTRRPRGQASADSALAGSLLSLQTWRDTLAVFTGGREEGEETVEAEGSRDGRCATSSTSGVATSSTSGVATSPADGGATSSTSGMPRTPDGRFAKRTAGEPRREAS